MPVTCGEKDYLEQDQAVRGQNYVCLSFLSPTDAVASREAFAVSRFLGAFAAEAGKLLDDAAERCNDEATRQVIRNLQDRYSYIVDKDAIAEEYERYCSTYSEQIKSDWAAKHGDGACVYGIKIRGAYETMAEAQSRAISLKKSDPNFSVYVCEVGCWVPWAPNPDDISDAEYSETQLNTMMKKYKENMALRDELYEKRKQELYEIGSASASDAPGGESFTPDQGEASASDVLASIV